MASPRFTLRRLSGVPDHAYSVRELGDSGDYAYHEYVSGLQPKQREKIKSYLLRLAEHGSDGFGRTNQFETFPGGIYELKPKPYRLLIGRIGNTWVIVDAFSKDGLKKREQTKRIDDARGLLFEYAQERLARRKK